MKKYKYSQISKINKEPYHYHYTTFEGQSFLNSYFDNRLYYLNFLNNIFKSNKSSKLPKTKITNDKISNFYINGFNSNYDLEKIYDFLLINNNSNEIDLLAESLLRKYEISKKVRSEYGPMCKKITLKLAKIDSYCFFSAILSMVSLDNKDIRFLNSILKINDLICSNCGLISNLKAKNAFCKSINIEMKLIKKLIIKNQINLNE